MGQLAMTGARGVAPFARLCDELGDDVLERVLRSEGVPRELIAAGAMMPLLSITPIIFYGR